MITEMLVRETRTFVVSPNGDVHQVVEIHVAARVDIPNQVVDIRVLGAESL